MTVKPNKLREKLAAGEIGLGFSVNYLRTPDVAKIANACGYDWIKPDMEHATYDIDMVSQMCMAALDVGCTSVVRVPGKQHFHASRMLDGGAQGIIIPHVDSVEEAKAAVDHCKFPPIGHRSSPGPVPQLSYGKYNLADAMRITNENTLVVIMLETPAAIELADDIAALEGVDIIHVGSNDLTAEMGIPGQYDHERVIYSYQKVTDACKKHGKIAGMGGIYDEPNARRYIDMGCRFINAGGDLGFMMSGAQERSGFLSNVKF
jgi:2-keto-3-deoxy-L-rhamnonate aldolase RhmA